MRASGFPAPSARFSAVLFDLDGTLADSAHCGYLATRSAFELFDLPIPSRDEVIRHMGIPIEDSFPIMAPPLGLSPRLLNDVITQFRKLYADLADEHIRLFPGVISLLDELAEAGTPLAIVTSKHVPVALRNLSSLRIASYFRAVVGPEMVTRPKPAGDTAIHALSLLGIAASESVLVVGDASFDILMGHDAGVQTCAVGWGAHSLQQLAATRPTHQVALVEDLRSLLLPGVGAAIPAAKVTLA